MKKFGIDVSAWQKGFNFAKAKAEGVEFVVLRGAYSAPGVVDGAGRDTCFVDFYAKVKAQGLPVGAYQYSMATNKEEALAEALYFEKNVLQGRQFDLPVYIDLEDRRVKTAGKTKITEIAKAWCEYLESKGYFVGIYASRSFFSEYLNDSELQNYAHWVAQWTKEPTYKGNNGVFGMWQFGGETNKIRTNIVAGVVCDQNYMMVDYPTIIKKAKLNGYGNKTIQKVETVQKVETKKEIKVGDLVYFSGGKHYVSASSGFGFKAKEGKAKVTNFAKGKKHPYHVVHTDNKSNVYGWVDESAVKLLDT